MDIIDVALPLGFKDYLRGKLDYVQHWKDDTGNVVKVMTKVAEEVELVES